MGYGIPVLHIRLVAYGGVEQFRLMNIHGLLVLCQPDGFADASAGVEGLHQREGCAVFHVTPFESERIALGQVHGKFDGISGVLEVCVSRQLGL